MLIALRDLFAGGRRFAREDALHRLARKLGYKRVGPTIREILSGDLRAAVRRGILENSGGELGLLCRRVHHYRRSFLQQQFLASLGARWIERDEAPRLLARWLGFARTGSSIEGAVRSLINGLLRTGRLESNRNRIRRV